MSDRYDLQRFVDAQEPVWQQVLEELREGDKRTHWMWFVFPQLQGLGHSATAKYYALSGLDEAAAYLEHELLGARLRICCAVVNELEGLSVKQIFGHPDDLKFHSSMTLFAQVAGEHSPYAIALAKYFGGQADSHTLRLLQQ
ncbi:DUF1810 domain-containing protein [Pseudomonas asuensis]|uniref:DUF1810 domain-containing protein n=1 Tax=Pseudomonas asuensis TaxID=1825787 RepID=A0ABQ2GMM2_9PSED|nr:DUF1810 domain-containing protein [Pseudomonas asuensis]GGM03402.1 hypothetical protein GCM10009425_13370 [Pseudomonas asuensis]